jgi:hypothetical protein
MVFLVAFLLMMLVQRVILWLVPKPDQPNEPLAVAS